MQNKKTILLLIISTAFLFFPHQAQAATITLSLSPASESITVNATFDVAIVVDTGAADTSGVDAMISFDNTKLNLTDIIPGSIYDQYIGENIDNANGLATISGLSSSTTSLYNGTGTLATLRFRGIETGTANVSFQFTPGNKNDTNVAQIGVTGDALTSVSNGTYTITGSSAPTSVPGSSNSSSNTSSGTQSPTSSPKGGMPVSGNSLPALLIGVVGGFFLWIGTLFGKENS